MFKRKWSGLPADPHFPSDLKELGYFVNEDDEVRSIAEPDRYFKFFLNRNPRWNERQRFAMNQALQSLILARLSALGLQPTYLPLGVIPSPSTPHLRIYTSRDLSTAPRVALLFGETTQDLGVLAHRVIGGKGGIDAGSWVAFVRDLLSAPTPNPGIILASPGSLLWSPSQGRTLSRTALADSPMASAAHAGNRVPAPADNVPGNRTPGEHVRYVFEAVVPRLAAPGAVLDVVGVGDGADLACAYLDQPGVWERWGPRMGCLASVGGMRDVKDVRVDGFREFLRARARAYVPSPEPAGMTLSGPDGNPRTATFTSYGCPVFSSGEAHHVECGLVAGRRVVVEWLREVAAAGPHYRNPEVVVLYSDPVRAGDAAEPDWSPWVEEFQERKKQREEEEEERKKKGDDKFVVRVDTLSDSEDED
ncbi:Arb2 domain-containing protein [Camillea tinctor]|nr:Arb2 domain-containing protein [Camillea tinctor]